MKKNWFLFLFIFLFICPSVIKAYDDPEIMNPTCSLFRGEYYGMKGTVVDKETYEQECNPKCRQRADKYYDNDGKEITKEVFDSVCTTSTGSGPSIEELICVEVEGRYFGSKGVEVEKSVFETECKSSEPTQNQLEVASDPSFMATTLKMPFADVASKYKAKILVTASMVDGLTIEDVTTTGENNITIKYKYVTLTKKEENTGIVVYNFANNQLTYTLASPSDHMVELYLNKIFTNVLVEVLIAEEKGMEFDTSEIISKIDDLTLEKNGIKIEKASVAYNGITNENNQPESGIVEGYKSVTIDLSKISFDEFNDVGNSNTSSDDENLDGEISTGDESKKCTEGDGVYYDKNGNLVSKEAYFVKIN